MREAYNLLDELTTRRSAEDGSPARFLPFADTWFALVEQTGVNNSFKGIIIDNFDAPAGGSIGITVVGQGKEDGLV